MTNWSPREGKNVVAIVVDIRFSSEILDELAARWASFDPYIEVVKEMERAIVSYTEYQRCLAYKFTGDGWIVFFDGDTDGPVLWGFMSRLSSCYATHSLGLLRHLRTPRPSRGLTFGVDNGSVKPLAMFGSPEYIGRTIVIASRLQSRARDSSDDYAAYISNTFFRDCFAAMPTLQCSDELIYLKDGDNHRVPCKSVRVPAGPAGPA